MHKCIYSLFSIDLTQITHQVVYLCSFKRAVIASENMFNTVKNFLKFSLRLHWGTFIAQDIFYLPLEKMNQLDKANFRPYFYQSFCVNESTIKNKIYLAPVPSVRPWNTQVHCDGQKEWAILRQHRNTCT